jgi:methylmalonyl-CoA mutase N-terminal domain/subunit
MLTLAQDTLCYRGAGVKLPSWMSTRATDREPAAEAGEPPLATDAGVPLRHVYRPDDHASIDYGRDLGDPGEFPFTRGRRPPRSAGVTASWIQRELSGEGSPKRSNLQFRELLAHGALGVDVIGDSPTMAALDPDHPMCVPAVGTGGVSLCRRQDFIELFEGIPLDEITASHSLPAAFAIAGQYLAAQANGVDPAVLRGSAIQAPLYGEDCSYATFMPVALRMRLCVDSIVFSTSSMPRFHAFLEDTYFISDGGLNVVEEMALGFVEIREVTRRLLARGLPVDAFAPRIAILVNCRMDLFEEIAKVRAVRRLYARMMRDEFGAADPRSLSANVTVHTSGLTLTAAQPINNVVRGAVQAVAMAMAGVQGLEISTFDEAFRTPSRAAHVVAMRTQQVISQETGVARVADPLGGSWYVESLTDELERRIDNEVRRIESLGDVGELVEAGFFRELFLHGMDRHAQEVQSGERRIVGVNCNTMAAEDDTLLREVAEERFDADLAHVERIRRWRGERDAARVRAALEDAQAAAAMPDADLMAPIVAALDQDGSIGEIAGALRAGYGLAAEPFPEA